MVLSLKPVDPVALDPAPASGNFAALRFGIEGPMLVMPGTVRGLHFQVPPRTQAKLVRVLRGAVLDIVVDLRRSSGSYGRHLAAGLDAAEGHQLYVPPGFAHGFCTLEPDTVVAYKVSAPFAPELDRCLAWDDPDLDLPWPFGPAAVVLSDRDRRAPKLRDLPACFD